MDYGSSINEVYSSIIDIEFHDYNEFCLPLLALHKIMKIHLFEHCCPVYLKLMTILIRSVKFSTTDSSFVTWWVYLCNADTVSTDALSIQVSDCLKP